MSARWIAELPRKSVESSGCECATAAAATEPPAPGLFSTMTVPSVRLTLSAHGRPMMSNAPPGGNGKMSLIGRVGKLSALASRGAAENAVTPATSCRNRRRGNVMNPQRGETGRPPSKPAYNLRNGHQLENRQDTWSCRATHASGRADEVIE